MKSTDAEEPRPGVLKALIAIAAVVIVIAVIVYAQQVRQRNDPTLTAAPPPPAGAVPAPLPSDAVMAAKHQVVSTMAAKVQGIRLTKTGEHKVETASK